MYDHVIFFSKKFYASFNATRPILNNSLPLHFIENVPCPTWKTNLACGPMDSGLFLSWHHQIITMTIEQSS